jgi:hypothetical protein
MKKTMLLDLVRLTDSGLRHSPHTRDLRRQPHPQRPGTGRPRGVLHRCPGTGPHQHTWRRLAPAAGPAPKDRGRLRRGRVHVVQGGDTVRQAQAQAQVLTLTDCEALGRVTGVC